MAKTVTLSLTKKQAEMVLYELQQSIRGDNDAYDRQLKNIIKKLEDQNDRR